jgi:hypothetical protein
MKPLSARDLTNCAPIDARGRRTPADILSRASRDHLLRLATERFFAELSARAAAELLCVRLARFRAGSWRRDRSEDLCPAKHHQRLEGLLWQILRVRDAPVSSRTIRKALAGGFPRPNI